MKRTHFAFVFCFSCALQGGAAYSEGALSVVNSNFASTSSLEGGCAYAVMPTTIVSSQLFDCTSSTMGGAVAGKSSIDIVQSAFISCNAKAGNGGAVAAARDGVVVTVTGSSFRDCNAALLVRQPRSVVALGHMMIQSESESIHCFRSLSACLTQYRCPAILRRAARSGRRSLSPWRTQPLPTRQLR